VAHGAFAGAGRRRVQWARKERSEVPAAKDLAARPTRKVPSIRGKRDELFRKVRDVPVTRWNLLHSVGLESGVRHGLAAGPGAVPGSYLIELVKGTLAKTEAGFLADEHHAQGAG
jgi:hypothetical protein